MLHQIGRWWAVDVPGLDLHSQCRTLDEGEGLARNLIAEAIGAALEAIILDIVVTDFAALLGSVRKARQRRAAAVAAEQRAISEAVRELAENLRVSRSDAARLLGLSPEEVARFMPPGGVAPYQRKDHRAPATPPSARQLPARPTSPADGLGPPSRRTGAQPWTRGPTGRQRVGVPEAMAQAVTVTVADRATNRHGVPVTHHVGEAKLGQECPPTGTQRHSGRQRATRCSDRHVPSVAGPPALN
ncbi:hypothetical protein ACIG0D_22345 [Streptomyces sp. NPDC052773]|uniref:hypothetical protein n=1 Tax=Streptomyces sp. NPDC052773 TaxID=3365693 RepID=UPI0037D07AD8